MTIFKLRCHSPYNVVAKQIICNSSTHNSLSISLSLCDISSVNLIPALVIRGSVFGLPSSGVFESLSV